MSEIALLNKKIEDLELVVQFKNNEILKYQNELKKISHTLDLLLYQSEQDVEKLNQIQQVIVPSDLPQFPGFEISRKFVYGTKQGGDYFDLYSHPDKMKFSLLLSSSTSYTMSAALLSVILQSSSELEGRAGQSIDQAIQTITLELNKITSGQDESHLMIGQFDRRDMSFKFCCFGDIGCYFQDTNQKNLQILTFKRMQSSLKKENAPIKARFQQIELKPSQRLCFISKGLLEILSDQDINDILKTDHVASVHQIRNQILVRAQLKSGLEQPHKDQTVIIIELKENMVRLA